eukprot:COSAG02_NODE_17510_length_998_cov_4.814238_1_plen_73_part_10
MWSDSSEPRLDIDAAYKLVHMARLPPPGRRSTLILLTPDGEPHGGPLTQLALGLHTVARQRMQQQQSSCGTYQ